MPFADEATPFVIAADAGGTHSRVACFGLDGSLLGSATGGGGSPYHQADAERNVADTTERALASGGLDAADAVGLVAGLAMVSRAGSNQGDGDNGWARDFFLVPGLSCERSIVNDAVVAHRGALSGRPGIVVVSGTGSMTLAIDADGTETESGQFEHYAGAARHLAHEALQLVLIGAAVPADREFVRQVVEHWDARDVEELRRAVRDQDTSDRMALRHHHGRLAPIVTAAASSSPLADRALRTIAARTARGVQLLAPLLADRPVEVATIGGVGAAPAFVERLVEALADEPGDQAAAVVAAEADPLRGAAVMALAAAGAAPDGSVLRRLRESQELPFD